TLAGGMVGTIQYMAPEQLEGFECDARTDIFSLGLILYEMATGARAFSAQSTAGTIPAVLAAEPAPLTLPPFSMSHAFEHAVRKCLAKQSDDRWQSIDDLRTELDWIRANVGTASTPAPTLPAVGRISRVATGWALTTVLVSAVAISIL